MRVVQHLHVLVDITSFENHILFIIITKHFLIPVVKCRLFSYCGNLKGITLRVFEYCIHLVSSSAWRSVTAGHSWLLVFIMKFKHVVFKLSSGGARQILRLISTGGTQSR